jgi:hypothetical protein
MVSGWIGVPLGVAEELPAALVVIPERLPVLLEHVRVLAQVGDGEQVERDRSVATVGLSVRVFGSAVHHDTSVFRELALRRQR